MSKELIQFLSNRVINDVNRKLSLPDPHLFAELVKLFYEKKINNIQFKRGVKELQNDNNINK